MSEQYSPTKPSRARPVSFAFPSSSSSSSSFNSFSSTSRPTSPESTPSTTHYRRPTHSNHRSTASLSSLAQLNLTGSHSPLINSPTLNSFSTQNSPRTGTGQLERSPSLVSSHWGTFSTVQTASGNGVGREFEDVQNRTFAKWLNARLEPNGFPPVSDLGTDFSDGTRLIQLIEVLTEVSLGRFNQNPVLRVQKMENTKQALDRIKEMGVHLTNIGPEDIVDGNRKLILGMIWSLVLRFSIADISEQGSSAKEGLLLWCQRRTVPYDEVDVRDFTRSWMDGLAFCALIHRHRPDLLDYSSLPKDSSLASSSANLSLAFKIAEQHLGIPQLLDVEDVCGTKRPDERSIMTYVAQFFHAFSSKAQQESESRVISHFVENMSELMLAVHDYERRVTSLLSSISAHLETLLALPSPLQTPYPTLLSLLSSFTTSYYTQTRQTWLREKIQLVELLNRIREKLRTYGLRAYEPGEGVRVGDLESRWEELERGERGLVRKLTGAVERLRREAREKVRRIARGVEGELRGLQKSLGAVGGPLESQLEQTRQLSTSLPRLRQLLSSLSEAESACLSYDVQVPILLASTNGAETEDDLTIHTSEGLMWELELVEQALKTKISFIENQIVARKQTSLTPEQLEEFESAFRAFDKDGRNKLGLDELVGALRSLGVAEINLDDLSQDENDEVSFEEFIRFLTERAEDRLTGEKVRSCFRSVASEKGYVTELDLTRLSLPSNALKFLKEHMPEQLVTVPSDHEDGVSNGGTKEEVALDYEEFLNQFLE